MEVTVGTFNLNNLFSRYNFKGEIKAIRDADTGVDSEVRYEFGPQDTFKIRSYRGRLVTAKDPEDAERVAGRIRSMNVDVLAVQEVEDIDTLKQFNREHLGSRYPFVLLVEGNDPRLIDVGFLSTFPIGGITSWQRAVHPDDPNQPVFGRDLLEVEVLDGSRSRRLLTVFNNHLKSHYVDFRENPVIGEQLNSERRRRQAEIVAKIVKARMRPNSRFIVLGDMNDPPDSPDLQPLVADPELNLVNALVNPVETRRPKRDTPPPPSPAWTHRFKASGRPARYELYDQIWLSSSLAPKQTGAWIDRRKRHTGDGSDHDPAWVRLAL